MSASLLSTAAPSGGASQVSGIEPPDHPFSALVAQLAGPSAPAAAGNRPAVQTIRQQAAADTRSTDKAAPQSVPAGGTPVKPGAPPRTSAIRSDGSVDLDAAIDPNTAAIAPGANVANADAIVDPTVAGATPAWLWILGAAPEAAVAAGAAGAHNASPSATDASTIENTGGTNSASGARARKSHRTAHGSQQGPTNGVTGVTDTGLAGVTVTADVPIPNGQTMSLAASAGQNGPDGQFATVVATHETKFADPAGDPRTPARRHAARGGAPTDAAVDGSVAAPAAGDTPSSAPAQELSSTSRSLSAFARAVTASGAAAAQPAANEESPNAASRDRRGDRGASDSFVERTTRDEAAALAGRVSDTAPAPAPGERVAAAARTLDVVPSITPGGTTAAASTAAPAPPSGDAPLAIPDESDLRRQLVQAIKFQWNDGAGDVKLTLQPGYLGDVAISLRVEQNGGVTAHVNAEASDVRAWISANEPLLRQGLSEQGLTLDRLVVAHEREEGTTDRDGRRRPHQEDQTPEQSPKRRETATFEVIV